MRGQNVRLAKRFGLRLSILLLGGLLLKTLLDLNLLECILLVVLLDLLEVLLQVLHLGHQSVFLQFHKHLFFDC